MSCALNHTWVKEHPCCLDGLWPLSVEHHQHKLETVHSNIQQRTAAQLLLHWAGNVELRGAKVGLHQLHIPQSVRCQQPAHLGMHREAAGPDGLRGTEQTTLHHCNSKQFMVEFYLHRGLLPPPPLLFLWVLWQMCWSSMTWQDVFL